MQGYMKHWEIAPCCACIMHMLNTVATRNAIIQMENFQMHHSDTGKHFKTDGKVPSNGLHFRHRRLSRYALIKE